MHRDGDQPGDDQQRAGGGQPVELERRDGRAARRGVADVQARPVEAAWSGLLGQEVLDGRDVGDREDHDDDRGTARRPGPRRPRLSCRGSRRRLVGRPVPVPTGRPSPLPSGSRPVTVGRRRRRGRPPPAPVRAPAGSVGRALDVAARRAARPAAAARPRAGGRAARRRCRSAAPRCSWRSTNCATREDHAARRSAGSQVCRTPRRPSTMNTRTSGTNTRQDRRLPADHRAERVRASRPGSSLTPEATVASVTIGTASAPKATGAVLATSATVAALTGLKPSAISMTHGDRHRGAEAGQRLEQRTEAERDDDRLDPLVGADLLERAAQHVEVPGRHGQVVDPDRVDDDPQDREEAEQRRPRWRRSSAWPTGIANSTTATTSATASEIRPAIQARICSTPSRTNSVDAAGWRAHRALRRERVADRVEDLLEHRSTLGVGRAAVRSWVRSRRRDGASRPAAPRIEASSTSTVWASPSGCPDRSIAEATCIRQPGLAVTSSCGAGGQRCWRPCGRRARAAGSGLRML